METFYSVLGVGPDADTETIVRAYRDKAKSHHPDVCDRSDATERFKRLTTAKEVLVDQTKRSEYDRLGHESYLRRHAECGGWDVESNGGSDGSGGTAATADSTASAASRAARAYADGGDPGSDSTPRREPTRAASGGTATAYYRPGQRVNPGPSGASVGVLSRFQAAGPWLFLAVVLCVAALAATSLHLSARAYA